jgi:hypothetical protein
LRSLGHLASWKRVNPGLSGGFARCGLLITVTLLRSCCTQKTPGVEAVVSGRVRLPHPGFDAMLLKEVVHHVSDRGMVIGGLARLLRPGGRVLVVMLPAEIGYPLFAEALSLFTRLQPDPAGVAGEMRDAGLRVELEYESFPLVFSAERYLGMVRSRYMSLLSSFDDERLEAGVAEIRRAHPGDEIEFEDRFAFVLGAKT